MAETKRISEKMEDQWFLKQDGCLYIGSQVTDIIFHSNLNVMLVFGRPNGLKVLDINSGMILSTIEGTISLTKKKFFHFSLITIKIVRPPFLDNEFVTVP